MWEVVRKGAKVYCCRHLPLKDYQLGEANRLFITHQVEFRLCRKSATRDYILILRITSKACVVRLCILQQKKQSFGKISLQHTACQSMTAKGLPGKQELQDEKELTTQNSCSRSLPSKPTTKCSQGAPANTFWLQCFTLQCTTESFYKI